MAPAVLHILLVLAGGERHGYAIMQDIERMTGGRLSLGPATLYRSLQDLLELGWIEERAAAAGDDPRRRTYRISRRGRAALRAELDRLAALVDAARARNLIGPASFEGPA